MEKTRNQKYKLSDLNVGDRFYFATDKKKIVHTVTAFPSGEVAAKKDGALHPDRFSGSQLFKEVIYLRTT